MKKKIVSVFMVCLLVLVAVFPLEEKKLDVSAATRAGRPLTWEADETWGKAEDVRFPNYMGDGATPYPFGIKDVTGQLYDWEYKGTAYDGTSWNAKSGPTLRGSYTFRWKLSGGWVSAKKFVIIEQGSGDLTMESWVLGETPKSPVFTNNTNTNVQETYTYEGRDGTTYAASSTPPTAVGKYKVTVNVGDDKALYYYRYSRTAEFEITEKKATLTYRSSDETLGTVTRASEQVEEHSGKPQGSTAQPKMGVAFKMWTNKNGLLVSTSQTYVPQKYIGRFVDATYIARFEAKTYKVLFDSNDGTNQTKEQTMKYYTAADLEQNTFTRPGYVFEGWSTTKDGAVQYTDSQNVTNLPIELYNAEKDVTLYAKWRPDTYTITYQDFDGSEFGYWKDPNKVVKKYDGKQTVTLPATDNIHKTGYVFVGWVSDGDSSGTVVTEIPAGTTGNKVFKAKWKSSIAIKNAQDTLLFGNEFGLSSYVDVTIDGQIHKGQELVRFYFELPEDSVSGDKKGTAENLKKFKVVWERKTQETKGQWSQIENSDGYITGMDKDGQSKISVLWDEEKQQYFAPLLMKENQTENQYEGEYRVSIAYDTDGKGAVTESQWASNREWFAASSESKVRVVETFDAVISIPSEVRLEQTKEMVNGQEKDIIRSRDETVTVKTLAHKVDATQEEDAASGDYLWMTPQSVQGSQGTYEEGADDLYKVNYNFQVEASWSGEMTSATYGTAIEVDLYNADTHQVDNQLRGAFQYDGTRRIKGSKKVFSFYLKGENPGAPKGTVFHNVITFQISKGAVG